LWKALIRLLSVECQPTKAVLAQIFMGVFLIRSVPDRIFEMRFVQKLRADRHGPPVIQKPV
jgi:hypothetical protein